MTRHRRAADPTPDAPPARTPHVWNVVDVRVSREPGAVAAELAIDGGLTTGAGLAAPGLVALLADSVLGTAAADAAQGRTVATAAMTVDFVRGPVEHGVLRGRAAVDATPRGDYLQVEGTIRDERGEVALARAWFAIRGERTGPRPRSGPAGSHRTPLPPVACPVTTAWADPCDTPLGRTLGITGLTRPAPDAVAFALPRIGELRNAGGTLHGGVGVLLANLAGLATLADAPPERWDVLSTTCHFLRAGTDEAGPLQVAGRRVRRGRTSAVVRGRVLTADGRCALDTTSVVALHG